MSEFVVGRISPNSGRGGEWPTHYYSVKWIPSDEGVDTLFLWLWRIECLVNPLNTVYGIDSRDEFDIWRNIRWMSSLFPSKSFMVDEYRLDMNETLFLIWSFVYSLLFIKLIRCFLIMYSYNYDFYYCLFIYSSITSFYCYFISVNRTFLIFPSLRVESPLFYYVLINQCNDNFLLYRDTFIVKIPVTFSRIHSEISSYEVSGREPLSRCVYEPFIKSCKSWREKVVIGTYQEWSCVYYVRV